MLMAISREEFMEFVWSAWKNESLSNLSADKVTVYDDEEIVKLRSLINHLPQTTGYPAQARKALQDKAYSKLASQVGDSGGFATIVMGAPASQKSRVALRLAELSGSWIVDSDLAKEELPEFSGGKFASLVHNESDLVRNRVLDDALHNRYNMVIPVVGKTAGSIGELHDRISAKGYKLSLVFIQCEAELSARRVVERFKRDGRFVDPDYALTVGDSPQKTFDLVSKFSWLSVDCISQEHIEKFLKLEKWPYV